MTKTINRNTGKYRNLRQNNVFGQFSYKTSKFGPNSTNLDPLTEFFWNPCSFFVVTYQAEHKNDKDNQHKRWQVPKFKAKQRFGLNFHTKRQNLSQMSPNSTVSASFLWTFGHFLLYPIRLSKKMPKDFKIFTDKYRNLRQNNGILAETVEFGDIWLKFWRFVWKLSPKRCFALNFGTCQRLCWLSLSFLCSAW